MHSLSCKNLQYSLYTYIHIHIIYICSHFGFMI